MYIPEPECWLPSCSSLGHDSDPLSETELKAEGQRLFMLFISHSSSDYCQLLLRILEGRRQRRENCGACFPFILY